MHDEGGDTGVVLAEFATDSPIQLITIDYREGDGYIPLITDDEIAAIRDWLATQAESIVVPQDALFWV
ncbi:hypothetical protein RZS08_43515, partial [Arthrospira platensis SPKY1]|nr:hypothetical protein [Arthrospira platensis SPKY1]